MPPTRSTTGVDAERGKGVAGSTASTEQGQPCDPDKMKVAELRKELKNRGLNNAGEKSALAKRLCL